MPYITQKERATFEPMLANLKDRIGNFTSKGELTYLFYCLALEYIKKHGESYTNISNTISSLNDAGEEIRRKVLNGYEDKKIIENGDVE